MSDRGWCAEILDESRSLGTRGTFLVALSDVQRLPGIDYEQIRPQWFVRKAKGGHEPRDHPPDRPSPA